MLGLQRELGRRKGVTNLILILQRGAEGGRGASNLILDLQRGEGEWGYQPDLPPS